MERIKPTEMHDSMRGNFSGHLYNAMIDNPDIVVVTADLGYGQFDRIRDDFPDRFINVGASEQAAIGIACGMALKGKIPFVYSITPFLLARPYEWIRNLVDHESIPIKLVGGGRDSDYEHDGYTHFAGDAKQILSGFDNIVQYWPKDNEGVESALISMITNGQASFISLKR